MSDAGNVLILGAGPTGMTAAMELSRLGIAVRLVEKTAKPATSSRAVGVQARTLELFEQRGMAAELVERGNKGVAVSAYGGGKRVFRLEFKNTDSKYHYILFVSQAETEQTLRDQLAKTGVEIEWGTSMIGFSQAEHGDGVETVLRRENGTLESVQSSYLISAEGAHSTVRETLGLKFAGRSLDEQYALGDFYIESDLPESDLHVFSSEHGFLGMFPMGGQRYRLIASNPISTPSKDTEPSIEELQQLYDQRSPIPARFHDMSWSSWFHINSRMIHQLRSGRIFLGGDSAHIHSPAGAQGMNTGIQDMINLSWKLAMVLKGEAKQAILDTYETDRIPAIENVLTKTEALTGAIGEENPIFRSVFNHLAPWLVGTDFVQQNSTERMSQLSLNYRESSISENHAAPGELKAGDRVPDLAVTVLHAERSTDERPLPTTLFQLMDTTMFTLLYSNLTNPLETRAQMRGGLGGWRPLMRVYEIGAAASDGGAFKRHFGASSSIVLVRPDGYIAFAGNERGLPQLARYCDKWLVTRPAKSELDGHDAA